jgi:hypothetical protein
MSKQVVVRLREIATGREGIHRYTTDDAPDATAESCVEFYWTDGNGGCDCTRGNCLAEALGEPDPLLPCGGETIALLEATVDGVVVLGSEV